MGATLTTDNIFNALIECEKRRVDELDKLEHNQQLLKKCFQELIKAQTEI